MKLVGPDPKAARPNRRSTCPSDKATHCDVAVVGAGAAGLATALALAQADAGLKVVLVSKSSPDAPNPPGPPGAARAYAIAAASRRMLAQLGVWESVAPHAQAMARIVVTDGQPGGTQLSLLDLVTGGERGSPTERDDTAYIVEEPALMAELGQKIAQTGAIEHLAGHTITDFQTTGAKATLTTSTGAQIICRLCVGADGAKSPLRAMAGIRKLAWEYGQSGLVATITHSRDHHGVAVERFLPAGPFAILPLRGNHSSLVWTETTAFANRLAKASAAEFLAELTLRFGTERGKILDVGPRAAFPLKFMVAHSFIAPRLGLVGDAAHVVHPLAGLGLNLGLRDVAALAQTITDAARLGLDIGAIEVLERYQRWRRFDTVMLGFGFDRLNALFSNDSEGLRVLRDLGLGAVQHLPLVKQMFAREAAGGAGTLPRLLAGKTL
ncbi:MAG: FAD-dependent oxidoreductase [Alphaproteobacteria bacterium]